MRIALNNLLWLQAFYSIIGIAYNVLSYYVVTQGGTQLSTTPPVFGGLAMFAYGLFLIPGFMGKLTFYRMLMGLSILIYGVGGIYKHFSFYASTGIDGYYSFLSWFLAWAINVFGLILNIVAVAGLYKDKG